MEKYPSGPPSSYASLEKFYFVVENKNTTLEPEVEGAILLRSVTELRTIQGKKESYQK